VTGDGGQTDNSALALPHLRTTSQFRRGLVLARQAAMRIVAVLILLVVWIAVWYTRRPRANSASPTTGIRIEQVLKTLFCVFVVLGALEKEVVQKYYSSPAPEPQLGRTVADEGTEGGTIYITPEANRLFWACFAICAVTFVCGMFWPSTEKTNDAKNRQSERRFATSAVAQDEPVCREVAGLSASPTRCGSPRVLDQSERLEMSPTTFSYYWQRPKLNRYVITAGVLAMTVGVWIDQRDMSNWWPRIIMSGVALWILHLLVDYRTCIDRERGTFTREKLLFGRYHVGALRLPLSEFTSVALDRYADSEDSTNTFYVCLRRRTGRLMQICYFRVRRGQSSDDAERAARELAEMTGLQYENAV